MIPVAINGFGRIGRALFRLLLDEPEVQVVAINDRAEAKTLAHLLKYDSVHGILNLPVEGGDGRLRAGDRECRTFAAPHPRALPWKTLGVAVVIEATGRFTDRADAGQHLEAGARKVIITAPAQDPDVTIALGVNEQTYIPARHHLISNGSCTTNCLATVAKVLLGAVGIRRGLMTTVHAYTKDQGLHDRSHPDLRRARAAGLSIIPTTTGAARAIGAVLPELQGRLDGLAIRVPTPNVSIIDLVVESERDAAAAEVNEAFRAAANGPMKGILRYTEEPLVSVDLNGDPHSAIVDGGLTNVIERRMVRVLAWYDNEWGYACRLRDLITYLARQGQGF